MWQFLTAPWVGLLDGTVVFPDNTHLLFCAQQLRKKAILLVLLCVMCPCVFETFPYGVSVKVSYLIVSILELCLLL